MRSIGSVQQDSSDAHIVDEAVYGSEVLLAFPSYADLADSSPRKMDHVAHALVHQTLVHQMVTTPEGQKRWLSTLLTLLERRLWQSAR